MYVVIALGKYMYLLLVEPSAFGGNPAARWTLYSEIQAQIEHACVQRAVLLL